MADKLTPAEEEWRSAVELDVRRRIGSGWHDEVSGHLQLGTTEKPADPSSFSRAQLGDFLREVKKVSDRDLLVFYAATFRVRDPHA